MTYSKQNRIKRFIVNIMYKWILLSVKTSLIRNFLNSIKEKSKRLIKFRIIIILQESWIKRLLMNHLSKLFASTWMCWNNVDLLTFFLFATITIHNTFKSSLTSINQSLLTIKHHWHDAHALFWSSETDDEHHWHDVNE